MAMTTDNAVQKRIKEHRITDDEAQAIGEALARELILRPAKDDDGEPFKVRRFDMASGTKTHRGLARTVQRIIDHRGNW